MCEDRIAIVIRAQSVLMDLYEVTSEAALSLLVWAATDDGVTVLEVASSICRQADAEFGAQIHAIA